MNNPFMQLLGLTVDHNEPDYSHLSLTLRPEHLNSNGVVHGAVTYAIADTGMGAALRPVLTEGQMCATIEIKMNYFKPITRGRLVCETRVLNRGKKIANLESRVYLGDTLVAVANGNYALFTPSTQAGAR